MTLPSSASDASLAVRKERKEDPLGRVRVTAQSASLCGSRNWEGVRCPNCGRTFSSFFILFYEGLGAYGGRTGEASRAEGQARLGAMVFLTAEGKFGERAELFLFGIEAPAAQDDTQAGHHGDGKVDAQDAGDFAAGHDAEDGGQGMKVTALAP